jgi:hypothetical protein
MVTEDQGVDTHGLTAEEAAFLVWLQPRLDDLRKNYPGPAAAAARFGTTYIDDADLDPKLPGDKVYVLTTHSSGRHGTKDPSGTVVPIEVRLRADVNCHCSRWDTNFHCITVVCP